MEILKIKSKERIEAIDITDKIEKLVKNKNSGIVFIYCPHTTAGLTINEGFDESVMIDLNNKLKELIPKENNYLHLEGNSDSHIKSVLTGNQIFVFFEKGKLLLGTWQKIFFLEFDGPRERKIWIKIVED
jgi:secondary thiamine-phosphate synthase enzyme